RSDAEECHWTQQEMSVNATFPFVSEKVIERGQRIAFRDPATDRIEVFEIRTCAIIEPDHYQEITAEHIALSELSDEHINNTEITDKTAAQALNTVLSGTLWSLGNNTASGTQSADIGRGSVWQAVNTIQENWNVYITPRVVISSEGIITGKYLDISPAQGVWRGVRLSIRKNLLDPVVTYNDEEVLTALYGYGGNVDVTHAGQDDTSEELTFASQVWTATSDHPAKPSGQTFLEWPEKTAIYGRNGRPRFGYYQNGNITDGAILLQKTWEALKKTADPKISISGTCSDLYRLGYTDEPIRLHDLVIVEIEETGETFQKEVITNDVDLLDQTGNRPEIGDYIPNIVYINRDTNNYAETGKRSGGGGGGGRGSSNKEREDTETRTDWIKTNEAIGMVVGKRNGGYYIEAGKIVLAINKSGETGQYESTAHINADHINISATQDVYTLAGDIEHVNGRLVVKNAGGMYIRKTISGVTSEFGVFDDNNLTAGVIATKVNGEPSTYIQGKNIYIGNQDSATIINGKLNATEFTANNIQAKIATLAHLSVAALQATGGISSGGLISTTGNISASGSVSAGGHNLNVYDAGKSGDTITIYRITGGNLSFEKGDVEAAYKQGWNECIDAATEVTRYTRSAGSYGGNRVHYVYNSDDERINVGTGWYKTSQANAYELPDKK
ncbi:MAG: phage tail protein, partial [Parasporobacterium sp.]|nr:phage tail protein [Parasporobacterium sp.]